MVRTVTKIIDNKTGRIDPTRLDVAAKPRRRRRARNRPEPPAELKAWEAAAEKRALARPYPPGIMLEPAGKDTEHLASPHSDPDLWMLQLAEAFGTRSHSVIMTFLAQLEALCGRNFWDAEAKQWRLDEVEYNAAIALVNSIKPRDELEAALAAQMVAVHLLTMKVAARAIQYEYDTRTAAVVAKLARTYAIQLETLRAGRTRKPVTRQSIKVRKELHQHVHYHGPRGEGETAGQPHGRAAADNRAALPSPEPGGESVSPSCDEGQGTVQSARR